MQSPTTFSGPLNEYYGVLAITGSDAAHFLQGQCTQDITLITPDQAGLGAFCQLQGRVLALCLIVLVPGGYWLIMPKSILPHLAKHLNLYRLRSKVSIADQSEQLMIWGLGGDNCLWPSSLPQPQQSLQVMHADSLHVIQLPNLPKRSLILGSAAAITTIKHEITVSQTALWTQLQIQTGTAEITRACMGLFTALSLNYLELGAISLTKGCYLGQEIIARMHYRGKSKEALFTLSCLPLDPIPNPGDTVWIQTENDVHALGKVVLATNNAILAVLQITLLPTENHDFSGWITRTQADSEPVLIPFNQWSPAHIFHFIKRAQSTSLS
jgi:folate-binding protein YgfZ